MTAEESLNQRAEVTAFFGGVGTSFCALVGPPGFNCAVAASTTIANKELIIGNVQAKDRVYGIVRAWADFLVNKVRKLDGKIFAEVARHLDAWMFPAVLRSFRRIDRAFAI